MATKEQERKALEQIRKIVEGLGEDSYIGTAFDGCFEKAEENIDNDWGCSWKDEAESRGKLLEAWNEKCSELAKRIEYKETELKAAERRIEEKDGTIAARGERIEDLNRQLKEACDKATERLATILEYQNQEQQYKMEIMKLKAKLYDLTARD